MPAAGTSSRTAAPLSDSAKAAGYLLWWNRIVVANHRLSQPLTEPMFNGSY
jgi:hypothetical protein